MESIAESRGWFVPHGEAAESQSRYAPPTPRRDNVRRGCAHLFFLRGQLARWCCCCRSAEERWAHVQNKLKEEFDEESSTPLDYMARGCEIPADVLDFTLFLQVRAGLGLLRQQQTTHDKRHAADICLLLQAHQQQLQSMRVPESLWRKLHNKVRPRICSVLTAVACESHSSDVGLS
jgi:hypothetical protein